MLPAHPPGTPTPSNTHPPTHPSLAHITNAQLAPSQDVIEMSQLPPSQAAARKVSRAIPIPSYRKPLPLHKQAGSGGWVGGWVGGWGKRHLLINGRACQMSA